MKMANKILLDFKDNPDLRAALSTKKPGDKFKIEIRVQVVSLTDDGLEGNIESVAPEGYVAPPGDVTQTNQKEIEVSPTEPVMVMMKGKRNNG